MPCRKDSGLNLTFGNKAIITSRVFFFFFHFAKSDEILCFVSFPKMISLMTAALTSNLDEKAGKRYRRFMTFSFTVTFSCFLWTGQMDNPSRQRQVATRTLIMGKGGKMDAPFG